MADKMKFIIGNRRVNLIRGMKVNLIGGGGQTSGEADGAEIHNKSLIRWGPSIVNHSISTNKQLKYPKDANRNQPDIN